MKKTKKILAVIISLIMIISAVPFCSYASDAQASWYSASDEKQGEGTFAQAVENVPAGGTVLIRQDISLSEAISVSKSFTIKSGSKGPFTISRASSYMGSLISISSGTVILTDITLTGGNKAECKALVTVGGGSLVLNSGAVLTSNDGASGGAVNLTGSTSSTAALSVNDGASITNCTSTLGGAVFAGQYSVVNINGGTISNNTTTSAAHLSGAIHADSQNARISIKGGTIENNTNTNSAAQAASVLYLGSTATAAITGGDITNNTGSCAVAYSKADSLTLGGYAYIYENKTSSGTESDVYLPVTTDSDGNNTVSTILYSPEFQSEAKVGIRTSKDLTGVVKFIGRGTSDTDISTVAGHIYYNNIDSAVFVSPSGKIFFEKTCVIKLDANGGNLPDGYSDTIVAVQGSSISNALKADKNGSTGLPVPTKSNSKFVKWVDEDGNTVTSGTVCPSKSEMTLTAQWLDSGSGSTSVFGKILETIGRIIKYVTEFLQNLFNGTGNDALKDFKTTG
jgi:hypothetical protein